MTLSHAGRRCSCVSCWLYKQYPNERTTAMIRTMSHDNDDDEDDDNII